MGGASGSGARATELSEEAMTENAHRIKEALARICDGPSYDGRGVPTDRPYGYRHKKTGLWAYARSTTGLFVAVMCDDPSLPDCRKNIDRHLAVKRNPDSITTAGRLRGWLGGLAAGGLTLGRFGYTVFEIQQLSAALDMPFIGDGDVTHVHAPVVEFYRVDRMRRRIYLSGIRWRVSSHPREYSLDHPLPGPFTTIPDFIEHVASGAAGGPPDAL